MGISFEDINPGDSITIQKDITAEMIDVYAAFTGDFNPVHIDEAYCIEHG